MKLNQEKTLKKYKVINDMANEESPGEDGLQKELYYTFQDMIVQELCEI